MEAIKIETLNPKALKLLIGMQDFHLIRMIDKAAPVLKNYLKKSKHDPGPKDQTDLWKDFSAHNFLKGYADYEPIYTQADIKEPNIDYKGWKEK